MRFKLIKETTTITVSAICGVENVQEMVEVAITGEATFEASDLPNMLEFVKNHKSLQPSIDNSTSIKVYVYIGDIVHSDNGQLSFDKVISPNALK